MRALYKLFASTSKKIHFFLGGMRELGETSPKFHREIYDLFSTCNVTFIGSEWEFLGPPNFFGKRDEISKKYLNNLKGFDLIVIKGSRGYELDKLIPILEDIN